jgi:hypothetical protein
MSAKYLIPALLVSLLAGCASTTDLARAPSELDYVYPNWVQTANPAGTSMTDGHPESATIATVKGGGSAQ